MLHLSGGIQKSASEGKVMMGCGLPVIHDSILYKLISDSWNLYILKETDSG